MANDTEADDDGDAGASNDSQSSNGGIVALPAIIKLAKVYDLDAAAFVYTFRSVAMPHPHTDAEFVSCCLVAAAHGLNPLTKELYFMKTKAGQIQPIVSVDGWIKKCNEHTQFDGIEFEDIFTDGKISAVRCTIYRKDRTHPTSIIEYMAECAGTTPPWKSHPIRMLRHRALMQCARIAFGFAGLMDRDEFDQWQMRDTTPGGDVMPRQSTRAAASLPDLPNTSMAALPSTDATPIAIDQAALLREIERRIEAEPAKHGEIETEYRPQIMAMDDDGKAAVASAIHAARSGAVNVRVSA